MKPFLIAGITVYYYLLMYSLLIDNSVLMFYAILLCQPHLLVSVAWGIAIKIHDYSIPLTPYVKIHRLEIILWVMLYFPSLSTVRVFILVTNKNGKGLFPWMKRFYPCDLVGEFFLSI